MTVLGAHVPVSDWTVLALLAGGLLSVLLWRPVVHAWHWQPRATLATLLFLTVTLALTVTPDGNGPPNGLAPCIPNDLPDLVFNIFFTGGGVGGEALNFLLMLPLTFSLVLASRRGWPALLIALALPVAVELAQTEVPGRYCAVGDVVTNTAGALFGTVLGWFVVNWSAGSR
jgi:VanZ family protein